MLTLVLDAIQKYEGYFGAPSICRLRVYAAPGRPAVAVATELVENPGTSVTNRADLLATTTLCLAAIMFDADPNDIVWIEHYQGVPHDPMPAFRKDRYARVYFQWDDREARFTKPDWRHITREGVEVLIGQSLDGDAVDPLAN
jgi:hypothetical protein